MWYNLVITSLNAREEPLYARRAKAKRGFFYFDNMVIFTFFVNIKIENVNIIPFPKCGNIDIFRLSTGQ